MEKFLYKRLEKKNPKINLWWAYGNNENFAMSSLGYLSIFKDFDLNSDIYTERIYLDTVKTVVPVDDVDCIGFSVSFELDILNIIKMLQKYNIPLNSKERGDNHPIVFAGGIVFMSNPFPYEEFFDFMVISEKIVLKDVFEILKNKRNLSKDEILDKLSKIKGIYVPKYKNDVSIVRDNVSEIISTPILSDKSYFKDTFIIEIERGCPVMCNFCLASWLNHPVRFVEFDKIINLIDEGLKYTNKIALLGAYVAGHPRFNDIIKHISKYDNIELNISSLRADLADENLIKTLVKCNQKTATVALEAGSQRLRDLINKKLSNEDIVNTVLNFQKYGLKGVKIYVIVGLPTETDDDIKKLVELISDIKNKLKLNKGGAFQITVSASTFVPKPNTPLEDIICFDKKILEERIMYLKKSFHKIGVDFRAPSVEWDMVQSVLSRCNISLFDFLCDVSLNGSNLGAFKKVFRKYNKNGLLPSFEDCAKAPFNNIKTLNWEKIDTGVNSLKNSRKSTLYRE